MRKLLLIFVAFLFSVNVKAQQYGNEWINFSQQYFKFPVPREGIYRIDSTTLSNYFNLSSVNPKNFQLFLKGKEQFLYIRGESDNKVNTGDYLEFYANSFMGEVDSMIYTRINYVPNPHKGLFGDTVYAFLTLNNSLNNKRYNLETDVNFGAYPAAQYFYNEKVFFGTIKYNDVASLPESGSDPNYTQAEGIGDPLAIGQIRTSNFGQLNPYTVQNLPAYLTVNYSGYSINDIHIIDHRTQIYYNDLNNNQVVLHDTDYKGYAPIRKILPINNQSLGNFSNFSITSLTNPNYAYTSNNTMLHYMVLNYPRSLNLNALAVKLFIKDETTGPKAFYNFSNFNYGLSTNVLFYDITNGKRISTSIAAGSVSVVIPNGNGFKTCYMVGDSNAIKITKLFPVGQNGFFTNYNTINPKKPFVIIYNKALEASVTNYKNYRQTTTGGGYDVVLANTKELFEQFSFGVNRHAVALKNFVRFLYDSLQNKPLYVFLIGKGTRCYDTYANFSNNSLNLVPCMGVPSCDNLYSSALTSKDTNFYAPQIPIGRIAAFNDAEVNMYLTKVQQHESAGQVDWKKNVLHFIGGTDAASSARFAGYMDAYKAIIEDTLFGGKVTNFQKNTTAPIQTNINDSVFKQINSGCSIINFFGHGGEAQLEIAIDDPTKYNNGGKYPFFIANSCNAGEIHIPSTRRSLSERFIFTEQKGSIGFISPTNYGFDTYMYSFTEGLYKAIAYAKYNKGLGDFTKYAAELSSNPNNTALLRYIGLDMTLHGDPSVIISPGALPDYQITNQDVRFDLKKYTDSLGIIVKIKNIGRADKDSFSVKINRFLPTGDSIIIVKTVKSPKSTDSLKFYSPIDFKKGFGLNSFSVRVDYLNVIAESNENNNSTNGKIDLFIPGGDILPVYPYKYAIVPKTANLTLKASTTDPFAPTTTYIFQLDTSDKFNNPLQTAKITSKGGVLEWTVNLPLKDSSVYYWRVSRDSISPANGYSWRESSFQTIGTKRGWGQAHFHQFKNNTYQFVKYNSNLRKFVFENSTNVVECNNGVFNFTFEQRIFSAFNKSKIYEFGGAFNGWNFVVFDSISGQPEKVYANSNFPVGQGNSDFGIWGNCVYDNNPVYAYSFGPGARCSANPNWKSLMETFINAIPPNQYVLAYPLYLNNATLTYAELYTYSNSLHQAFESLGAGKLRSISDSVPYILFGKKGMKAGQGNEIVGKNRRVQVYLRDSIKTRWHDGYITSELIGPSYKWNSLHWRVKSLDKTKGDSSILKVVGITQGGHVDTLATFRQDSTDILNLGKYVNAKTHPYLKLVTYMRDDIHTTSPQLKRWQVLYDEVPECAINPLKGFASINDTLQEGDKVTFRFPIENLGISSFNDSLVTTYWVEDSKKNKVPLPDKKRKGPFVPGQIIIDTVTVNSYQLLGDNALWIFVNPLGHKNYQLEQYQFNNIGRYAFKVDRDKTNPLLDVTFDGVRILNGDIVSARPNILISLKDENQFLALNDTASFKVYIIEPGQSTQKQLFFAQNLEFTPANLPKNSCSINYRPFYQVDGRYTLIVEAKDRSANRSGSQDYSIQFEVVTKPSVTNVLNYPNPFTSSTRFVFTLTGSEVPEVFTIRIMTVTGKIVREITRSELGALHIGRNITDYAWDGKDEYGDLLANGVYLYKVITKLNDENIEKSSSGADKFFVKEFGKMVLMR